MRSSIFFPTALLALAVSAAPAPQVDYTKIDYPKGTGENLPAYPPPPGGWKSVTYPPGTGSGSAACPKPYDPVFTSSFDVVAIGSEVRNGTNPAPGSKDATGYFHFRLNSITDTICFVGCLVHFSVTNCNHCIATTSTNNPNRTSRSSMSSVTTCHPPALPPTCTKPPAERLAPLASPSQTLLAMISCACHMAA